MKRGCRGGGGSKEKKDELTLRLEILQYSGGEWIFTGGKTNNVLKDFWKTGACFGILREIFLKNFWVKRGMR